jgi:hypothetical protein
MLTVGWDDAPDFWPEGGFWYRNWWWDHGRNGMVFVPYAVWGLPAHEGGVWDADLWTGTVATRTEPAPPPREPAQVYTQVWNFADAERTRYAPEPVAAQAPIGPYGAAVGVKLKEPGKDEVLLMDWRFIGT